MESRTLTLPASLVDRLEALAEERGRPLDEIVDELLQPYTPAKAGNWVLAVAQGMEAAEIDWLDDPDASSKSAEHFTQHLREQDQRRQHQ